MNAQKICTALRESKLFQNTCAQSKVPHFCGYCENKIEQALINAHQVNQPLHFILPAFPAKSANRDKTLSALPDLGEKLALLKLEALMAVLGELHTPGAMLTVCSDGHVFNDVVGVSTLDVTKYQAALKKCSNSLSCKHIQFFDLGDAFPNQALTDQREAMLSKYATPLQTIRAQIITDPGELRLFNGLHRFLYEDLSYLKPELSKNQRRKRAQALAYQTVQRSHAWSDLIAEQFPRAVRLSIHPHHCTSNKIPINLVPGASRWSTPWHNVPVEKAGEVFLMKRSEALTLNARFVDTGQVWDRHFVAS